MTTSEDDYLKLEYNKLNNEISKLSEEIRTRERYATTFAPLAGAWILVDLMKQGGLTKDTTFYLALLICAVTFLVILLYGLSVWFLYKNILLAGEYLAKLEEHFLKTQTEFGWEKFYGKDTENRKELVKLAKTSWIIYLLLPLVIILILYIIH